MPFKSKLEHNMVKIRRSPEALYELENAITLFAERSDGRLPDDEELEIITTLVAHEMNPFNRWMKVGIILLSIFSIFNWFVREVIRVYGLQ
jgi:hypothetical protein